MRVSDYIAKFLADVGVRHVFMVPGGNSMYLNDSLSHQEGIETVFMQHEQAAAIAAEAYAAASGGIGVCCTTSGPGATNAITGCLAAWTNSTPVLFLSGQCKTADLTTADGPRMLGAQEAPIVDMVRPITKYAERIEPWTAHCRLNDAVNAMLHGRHGPAWLELPVDVQGAGIANASGGQPYAYSKSDVSSVPDVIDLIRAAERPAMIAGNGIHSAHIECHFQNLIEQLGIPVLTTRQGCDLIGYDHPLSAGVPGSIGTRGANWTMQGCDLLLILGARMDKSMVAYAPERLAPKAKKIMVDIDRSEINKLGCIDVPIVCDVGDFIRAMLATNCIRGEVWPRLKSEWPRWQPWIEKTQKWKSDYPIVQEKHVKACPISVYGFAKELSDMLEPEDVILPGASGHACEIFGTALQVKYGQRVMHNKGTGAMGFCQPAAIGSALATGRRVVCVDGDGGFQLNIQELETIRRLNLNVKIFVINNGGYESIRTSQKNHFDRIAGGDRSSGFSLPNLQAVCAAYGIHSWSVSERSWLHGSIRCALQTDGPVVCEVVVKSGEIKEPCVKTTVDADGKICSGRLEDMWPPIEGNA